MPSQETGSAEPIPGRVLLTGASGFVGSHVAETLLRQGYRVRALVRRSSKLRWLRGLSLEIAYGDVTDKASLAGACIGVQSVFHFGALTEARSELEFQEVNEIGTRNLAESLAERGDPGGFFVYCSSLAAGGPAIATQSQPLPHRTEDDPDTPITPYGRSKLAGELRLFEVAQSSGKFRAVVLRPPTVYGPRDSDVLLLFRLVKNGVLPLPAPESARLSLIHVADLVQATLAVARSDVRGVYYVSDGEEHTWVSVGQLAGQIMHVSPRLVSIPSWVSMSVAALAETGAKVIGKTALLNRGRVRDMRQPHWVCSPARAMRDWGFQPQILLEDGLHETLNWYREQRWL
ncbi:MAG: NAD-dependent epimerase/dehydratase family protein [Candidatus Eisenbacteria bacterium]|uniref:NAD-dependent epimerase/dehydratase family protein n=1 Tax=Eiseniibacteriota bacterium TaxID=2212470 RepID=A0A956M2H8_UNCEI|nr:NAD-dependent epimerase/dehydratase family protein [Candidatus Eisenbacteria bacterium]